MKGHLSSLWIILEDFLKEYLKERELYVKCGLVLTNKLLVLCEIRVT